MSTFNPGLSNARVLLPITGSFVLPFAAYYIYLSAGAVSQRLATKQWIGEKPSASSTEAKAKSTNSAVSDSKSDAPTYDGLVRATRAHANFAENVPLAFLIAAIAELNGADRQVLTAMLVTLFAARVAHADFGLKLDESAMAKGRSVGYLATMGSMAGLAGYSAYLVKAYWGY